MNGAAAADPAIHEHASRVRPARTNKLVCAPVGSLTALGSEAAYPAAGGHRLRFRRRARPGLRGHGIEPGEWGRLLNGGARLTVEGQRVELLYRDLDVVRHRLDDAEAGRYKVDQVDGYLAGMASYALAAELALAEVLAGELPQPGFPDALRRVAPARWRRSAALSQTIAHTAAERHDVVACAGLLCQGGGRGRPSGPRRARRVGPERAGDRPAGRSRRPRGGHHGGPG